MRRIFKSIAVFILTVEARIIIRKYKPSIIAVTGSVGKTSTKDAIYAALVNHASVRKSEKSFNSELGLPLTIFGCSSGWRNPFKWLEIVLDGLSLIIFNTRYPEWLILEVGADRPGDIRRIARWLPVDIAVITKLPEVPAHVEYFNSLKEVIEEKAALISALKPSGVLVLYGDDTRVLALRERASHVRVITFGLSEHVNVRGSTIETVYDFKTHMPVGIQAQIHSEQERIEVSLKNTLGPHTLMPLLAAVAVGKSLNIPLQKIASSCERYYVPPPGRMHLLAGLTQTTIIDDSYNSSPAAVEAALETLGKLETVGRKIAMLGDMLELGRYSVEEHRKAGSLAAKNSDLLITVGFRARDIADAALDNGMTDRNVLQYEDADSAGRELVALLKEGDCILVKGSQSMRMERAVRHLIKEPDRAPELLVRQEREWQRR